MATSPPQALRAAVQIKAGIKQIQGLDVRIAIGIGERDYNAESITESSGSAFIRSGESFSTLKRQSLELNSRKHEMDEMLNLIISLASLIMDRWTPTVARIIKIFLENPVKNQSEIVSQMNKSQSSISEALKRGGYEEIKKMMDFYQKQIGAL